MDRFEELKERYAHSLSQKATELEDVWQQFAQNPYDTQARRAMHQCVHRLSGSAPAFGFERLGDAAQAVDSLLSDWLALSEFERSSPSQLQQEMAADVVALLAALHTSTA